MKRFLLTSMIVTSLAVTTGIAHAQNDIRYGKAEIAETLAKAGKIQPITNQADFRAAVIGPGTMSLMGSKLALTKATNPLVKDFANFEFDEQNALGMILKELQTPDPVMTQHDADTKKKLETATGAAFDRAYIQSQIEGHKVLLMFTETYLKNANMSSTDPMEMEARHLAYFMRAAIKQHISNTVELQSKLK